MMPESIVMFRDGVSEGQFQQVLDAELGGLRRAFWKIRANFNPKITYIIVTKRHHAKFFPQRTKDRTGNISAGTVVDTDIVSNRYYDFYLNSHPGVKGTNKPSKYTVLFDENGFTPDQLQAYIYGLTHGCARCNRSVSMVRPLFTHTCSRLEGEHTSVNKVKTTQKDQ